MRIVTSSLIRDKSTDSTKSTNPTQNGGSSPRHAEICWMGEAMTEETLVLKSSGKCGNSCFSSQQTVLKAKKQFMKDESPTRSQLLSTQNHRDQKAMKSVKELGLGTHSFNTSTWKAVAGRSLVIQIQLGLKSKFQASQSYKVRSCLSRQRNKENNARK